MKYVTFWPNQIYSVLSIYDARFKYITPYDIPEEWSKFFFKESINNIMTVKENPPEDRKGIGTFLSFRQATVADCPIHEWPPIPDIYPVYIKNDVNKDIIDKLGLDKSKIYEKDFPKWATDNIYSLIKDRATLTKLLIIN